MPKMSNSLYKSNSFRDCREGGFSSGGDAIPFYERLDLANNRLDTFAFKKSKEFDLYSDSVCSGGEETLWNGGNFQPDISDIERIVDQQLKPRGNDFIDKNESSSQLHHSRSRGKTLKYEIPKFYVLRSSSESEYDENSDNERPNSSETYNKLNKNIWRKKRRKMKEVSKFTLANLCEEVSRKLEEDAIRKTRDLSMRNWHQDLGQGDPPWVLIMDGSDEDEDEQTIRTSSACGRGTGQAWENRFDAIETIEAQDVNQLEIENNAKNAALHLNNENQQKKGHSEGKISRFFSKLRKTSSVNSADVKELHNGLETNGKDSGNIIISHDDNQSTSKKSKMCVIL